VETEQLETLLAELYRGRCEIDPENVSTLLGIPAEDVPIAAPDVENLPAGEGGILVQPTGEGRAFVCFPEAIVIGEVLGGAKRIGNCRGTQGVIFPERPNVLDPNRFQLAHVMCIRIPYRERQCVATIASHSAARIDGRWRLERVPHGQT
jgi:hypothetical protein